MKSTSHSPLGPAVNEQPPSTRARYRRSKPGVPRRTLKLSQRQRLIDAMIERSAQRGYSAVTVAELCSQAGVSPVTFYEQFTSKEDCFLAAYLACGEAIFGQMRIAAEEAVDWRGVARLALEALLAGLLVMGRVVPVSGGAPVNAVSIRRVDSIVRGRLRC